MTSLLYKGQHQDFLLFITSPHLPFLSWPMNQPPREEEEEALIPKEKIEEGGEPGFLSVSNKEG